MSTESGASSPSGHGGLFRSLWSAAEEGPIKNSDSRPAAMGWIFGCAALVFFLVVGILAYMTIIRSEKAMSALLLEKGSSLLRVFESALRTGMRGSAGLELQTLLEEMTRSSDIEFVAVTMPDGSIIAHSDRNRLGEPLRLEDAAATEEMMKSLGVEDLEKGMIAHAEGGRVFLVYRSFNLGRKDWPSDVPEPTIFLGMELSPFEITNNQNRAFVTMLSIVTLLVGLACLLALDYAQRAADSRKKQRKAEKEVLRLEDEIRRQEKLAAVGTLAAGVAHEIRNPLSSIKGYATYFGQRFPEGSEDREAANVMVNEVNRLNRVITDLLGLSRPSDVKLKPMCVENMVAHVLRLIRQNAARQHVEIECHFAPLVPDIMADMERLSQALLNLCLNALEAMPNGGKLLIAVSGGKKNVCLTVRDSGSGIRPEVINKIFDPYFTTKGSGTGLGLPMVHKILRAHGGEIEVRSRLADASGPGMTIFRLWLPIAEPEA